MAQKLESKIVPANIDETFCYGVSVLKERVLSRENFARVQFLPTASNWTDGQKRAYRGAATKLNDLYGKIVTLQNSLGSRVTPGKQWDIVDLCDGTSIMEIINLPDLDSITDNTKGNFVRRFDLIKGYQKYLSQVSQKLSEKENLYETYSEKLIEIIEETERKVKGKKSVLQTRFGGTLTRLKRSLAAFQSGGGTQAQLQELIIDLPNGAQDVLRAANGLAGTDI